MEATRRDVLGTVCALTATAIGGLSAPAIAVARPRVRVIVDNDFAGDPDGLFQLAHHLLSPSVAIPLIVGSHLHPGEAWGGGATRQAADAVDRAAQVLALLGRTGAHRVLTGREHALRDGDDRTPSNATDAIVAEAMRTDTDLPLYYAAGAGLTEIALAWRREPRIGRRLTLVWIGGSEHPGLALPPPGASAAEYNLTIDTDAARIVFDESDIPIWQVPRDGYRQMLMSLAELEALARRSGRLGAFLKAQLDRVADTVAATPIGETYILGDSPLVTLTALQSSFEPDPSSSRFVVRPTPRIGAEGRYVANPAGRPMRIYTAIDTRLTFADMAAKFRTSP